MKIMTFSWQKTFKKEEDNNNNNNDVAQGSPLLVKMLPYKAAHCSSSSPPGHISSNVSSRATHPHSNLQF